MSIVHRAPVTLDMCVVPTCPNMPIGEWSACPVHVLSDVDAIIAGTARECEGTTFDSIRTVGNEDEATCNTCGLTVSVRFNTLVRHTVSINTPAV